MILFLARHGSSETPGRFLGQSDPVLSELGRGEATVLAAGIAGRGVERIVSSGLRRSRQTAEIVGERMGLAVEIDPRLNEIAYGEWDGLRWSEIEAGWPSEAREKLENWWQVTPPGGEAAGVFFERVRGAYDSIRSAGKTTLLVGHAAVNGLVHEWAGGRREPTRSVLKFSQPLGTTIELSIK